MKRPAQASDLDGMAPAASGRRYAGQRGYCTLTVIFSETTGGSNGTWFMSPMINWSV